MADTKKLTAEDVQAAKRVLAEAERQEQEKAAAERAEAMKPKKFKPGLWIRTKDCYHNDRLYKEGDVVEFKKLADAPATADGYVAHFQPEA